MGEFTLKLTASEAAHLDGLVSAEAQAVVDRAKDTLALSLSGLSEKEAAMVATIVATAREKGRLTLSRTRVSSCPCCGRKDGYFVYPRAGKYHRKGAPNYSAPKTFAAFDLNQGFVTVQNHIGVGFCETCRPRVEPVLLPLLAPLEAEFPAHWDAAPHKWRRYDNKVCKACGWEGHEGEMRPMRTLMGNGSYPGGCPNCEAANQPLGRTVIDRREGFTLVPIVRAAPPAETDLSGPQRSEAALSATDEPLLLASQNKDADHDL